MQTASTCGKASRLTDKGKVWRSKLSKIIENHATDEQKANGYDLADYLINQQKQIIESNHFVDSYNCKLKTVLSDEKLFEIFETILDEQISILMIDGNLSRIETEQIANAPNNLRRIVQSL